MNKNGTTAMPIDGRFVWAKPAERPVMKQYDTSMPDREMKNDGLRPIRSVLTLAANAKKRFHIAKTSFRGSADDANEFMGTHLVPH